MGGGPTVFIGVRGMGCRVGMGEDLYRELLSVFRGLSSQ